MDPTTMVQIPGRCPSCGKDIQINIPKEQLTSVGGAPEVVSKLTPVSNILVYRITSEQIQRFLLSKARKFAPGVKIILSPRYCEKRRKNEKELHRSYAYLRIAFSEEILKKDSEQSFFTRIGESEGNIEYVSTEMKTIVDRYRYRRDDVDAWLKDYKILEELENSFGITESFIHDIRSFTIPQRLRMNGSEGQWLIFAAAPDNIIFDMLSDPTTHKPISGSISIMDVYQVSKSVVEFIVYVNPSTSNYQENIHVRQILEGSDNWKKKK